MDKIADFFNSPFFTVVWGTETIIISAGFIYTIILIIKGVIPVWYRLGMGLSKRKIAVFATTEFDSLKDLLVCWR